MSQSPYKLDGGRYEIQSLIGRGGMAEVHKAYDTLLSRTVAIKMLRFDLAKDNVFLTRFRREAQASASLSHENIVAVYDTGEQKIQLADGTSVFVPYIVMEYVEGHTVRELLTDGQPVPIGEAVQIMSGVLSALEYAHKHNLVHRDIKPANVMITNDCRIKVMDFGIARALEDSASTMTATDAVVGTAQYLSPEQARGEQVDTRSDLYSAGCMLFELLTGRSPFKGDSAVAVAYQHVAEMPPLSSSITPDIPPAIDAVCMKALAKRVEERYQTAAEMRADLQNAYAGRPIIAPVISGGLPAEGATQLLTNPGLAGAAAGASTSVIAGTGLGEAGATRVMTSAQPLPQPVSASSGYPTGQMPAYQHYANGQVGQVAAPPFPGPGPDNKDNSSNTFKAVITTILVVLIIAGVALLGWAYLHKQGEDVGSEVAIPGNIVGMSKTEALTVLQSMGLQGEVSAEKPSVDYEPGRVISSDPEPGDRVKKGALVRLVISSGPDSIEVPDLSNLTQENARLNLRNKGLEMGDVTTEDNPSVLEGRVIRSVPEAGTSVKKGSQVSIIISTGYVNLDPEKVVGKTTQEALAYLESLHLSSNTVNVPTSDYPEGTVISVDPQGHLKQNSQVTMQVAVKPAKPSGPGGGTNPSGGGSTPSGGGTTPTPTPPSPADDTAPSSNELNSLAPAGQSNSRRS